MESYSHIGVSVDWVAELRQAFGRLRAGQEAHVSFIRREDTVGEIGRAFNALAAELGQATSQQRTRAQIHALRNRLAGILAALHVWRETAGVSATEAAALGELLEEAKKVDADLKRV